MHDLYWVSPKYNAYNRLVTLVCRGTYRTMVATLDMEVRCPWSGQPLRQFTGGNTPLPVMCGATVVSCLRYGVWAVNRSEELKAQRYIASHLIIGSEQNTEEAQSFMCHLKSMKWDSMLTINCISQALNLIDGGFRLPPPPGCPFTIYNLMIKCWWDALINYSVSTHLTVYNISYS